MSAHGGVAESEPDHDERAAMLSAELSAARIEMVNVGSRLRITLQDASCLSDLERLATQAEAVSLQAGRLAGFARLLSAALNR